jgi:hypothetical protein
MRKSLGAVLFLVILTVFSGSALAQYSIVDPTFNLQVSSSVYGVNPVPADYDGDGKTDLGVFRPSNGGWYVLRSSNGSFLITAFGVSGDKPVSADYDGDGRADLAVFRPSTGLWYLLQTTAGSAAAQWGIATDIPTEAAYVP